ncbi:hypothetical protein BDQ12DRAFT_759165 [Crucibulum laeve]|uniref:Uncharacterized protein n=1 Tax=Crucibulum laeve TaxID=68775 RepID=A0A5C3LUL3_9AGAR|nr:hypothetical protein BDQ12DRAFT_759165 [Crucibulum laeve]
MSTPGSLKLHSDSSYTLVVEIATNQMEVLKSGGFNLCVAKKINRVYTVVWSGKSDYLHKNIFSWDEDYQVFGLNEFKVGALVQAQTNEVDIAYGQTCVLNSVGVMEHATGPVDKSGEFYVQSEYGKICLGVNQKLNENFLPIFVSSTVITGKATFEPIVELKVWLQTHVESGTMIFDVAEPGIEVTYSGGASKTVAYESKEGLAQWVQK